MLSAKVLWRIGPLLGNVRNMHATIEKRCFLCGQRRDRCYGTVWYTHFYNKRKAVFSAWSLPRSYLEEKWCYSSNAGYYVFWYG
jgi:hypothetical protein